MGFFSSRREPTAAPVPSSELSSSVKVIRSRFYGKNKSSSGRASPAPSSTLSSLPPPPPPPPHPAERISSNQSLSPSRRQVPADALTMSLAQRLNDLAVANADGLLDDEGYRLLRQNLFERFSTGPDSPTDATTIVPKPSTSTKQRPQLSRAPSVTSQRSISTAVSSLFRRATGRSNNPSPTTSVSGSVFSLQQQLSPSTDAASIYSRPSISSSAGPRPVAFHNLSRRPSDDSIMSSSQASGSVTHDLRSIASRHQVLVAGPAHYASSLSSRATTRSSKPPSSFNLRKHAHAPRTPSRTHEDDDDEDHPKSTAQLRAEIDSVESEGRKLLDAFNGVELTALTKSRPVAGPMSAPPDARRLSIYPQSTSPSALGSEYTLIPDNARRPVVAVPLVKQPISLKRKPSVVSSIAGSLKSSTSDLRAGFLSSAPPQPPQPLQLHSSRSSSNLHLPSRPSPPALPSSSTPTFIPPAPAIPTSSTPLRKRPPVMRSPRPPLYPSATAPVLRPSPLSNGTLADPALHALETELADIRRHKADVAARYERRLDFLRAKLKSAEIRERLSKK